MVLLGHCLVYMKRVKLRTITISVVISSLMLLTYQIMISYNITDSGVQNQPKTSHLKPEQTEVKRSSVNSRQDHEVNVIPTVPKNLTFRGVLENDKKYFPNIRGKIVCTMDSIEIDIARVNDDFCDCPTDGMDEPGTNACLNGKFFCNHQPENKRHLKSVSSSRVNDGICDCCDGSDEWAGVVLTNRLSDEIQNSIGRFQAPCSNHCKK